MPTDSYSEIILTHEIIGIVNPGLTPPMTIDSNAVVSLSAPNYHGAHRFYAFSGNANV